MLTKSYLPSSGNPPVEVKRSTANIFSGDAIIAIDHQNFIGTQFDRFYPENGFFDGELYPLIDWFPVVTGLTSFFGTNTSVMAFADWDRNPIYQSDLDQAGVEMINESDYPAKNIDFRMTTETMFRALTNSKIQRVILLTHDGDFSHMAKKLQDSGRIVIAIGIRDMAISSKLFAACDAVYKIDPPLPVCRQLSCLIA